MNNVSGSPAYAAVQAELTGKLAEVRNGYGDSDELDQQHLKRYMDWMNSQENR